MCCCLFLFLFLLRNEFEIFFFFVCYLAFRVNRKFSSQNHRIEALFFTNKQNWEKSYQQQSKLVSFTILVLSSLLDIIEPSESSRYEEARRSKQNRRIKQKSLVNFFGSSLLDCVTFMQFSLSHTKFWSCFSSRVLNFPLTHEFETWIYDISTKYHKTQNLYSLYCYILVVSYMETSNFFSANIKNLYFFSTRLSSV